MPPNFCPSESAESFAKRIRNLHADIRRKIALSNENYKLAADVSRRNQEFNEGDYVMVRIRLERYPKHFFKKLHARAIGPHRIIRKLGPNAYLIELPSNMSISPIFNVEDLFPYRGTFEPPIVHTSVSAERVPTTSVPVPPRFLPLDDYVEDVLDDETVGSKHGGFQRYLIKGRDRPILDATS
ncbi:hypothetical protein RHSIM_Rhsim06G0128700 [Rhododendron simsii]|uniref:Tf2-1-like SH3-like domain-containing protein n=1 Tax=Rhododendron simsii TaxID=118357 RepID=A0A834H5X0_RHOSS|nr:hypothetical protein RHSIM_Rhsim06G0128700 [Rhododendron simsii]